MRENKALGIIFPSSDRPLMGALMDNRTIGAVPFGGRYRLIDFTLSNMVHSGIWDVGVITRTKYQSLMDHIGSGRDWDLARKNGGLSLLPPLLDDLGSAAYLGELQSLLQYKRYIESAKAKYVVLAHADIIGEIDLDAIVDTHIDTGADITVLYHVVSDPQKLGEGSVLFKFDENERVYDVNIGSTFEDDSPCCQYLRYMVIEKEKLLSLVSGMTARGHYTMVRDVIQGSCASLDIRGYRIDGYCRMITDLQSYYEASMELLDSENRKLIFPPANPVLTRVRDEVPVKYGSSSKATNSLIADGCIIDGEVENCILFRGVTVGKGARLKNCIIMQNSVVEEDAQLSYVICDRRCYIKSGRVISGFESYPVVIGKESVV